MSTGSVLLDSKKILREIGLREGDKAADFGAGRTGHFVFPASQIVGEEGTVYAVDIVKDVLAMIDGRRKLFGILNMHTVWGDFEREGGVRIKDHTLDWVLVVNNVWCVKDVGVLAHEIKRVLKPEGKILVVDWSRRADSPAAPPKDKRKEAMEVEARFLQEGIVKDRDLQVNDTHWGVVFRIA
ncbi:class I SAM-dependent methyltransferase [Candidatus Uhrbacteria bacterium]|jgi:ubiquinone/menaquinone biosynthesis C-methylase UbiE|nr:class I SAM-dependent methyltransferase [Candidatus Uhrbacteria bacterium]MBT7716876.1 class I SAM-dependent methyltransferase [Candidatus Uhrbacteria bacterium]